MFVICAMLGSLAGSLFAHYVSYISVQSFTVERSIAFLLIPVVAGSTSVWGIIAGALFVTLIPELLSGLGDIHQVLFGLALVLVVTLLPDGLIGPNGSGKSTCFNIVSGFLRPKAGRVLLSGRDMAADSIQARTRHGLMRT
ncbi:ATP-binding cassette domain-containing protein, partial [Cupriavidus sp. 2MCAB6]|uniref:ATP-binding cassette domain-containing protein n=1 Tax=Cupriavidus sp. 2MCAB6 TaxID=3232981 RepID=UPI003F907A51